jgi:hypothetical protein
MAQCHHVRAPFDLPSPSTDRAVLNALWAESVVRRELKRSLSRMKIPFDVNDSTATLGMLQEAAHLLRSQS